MIELIVCICVSRLPLELACSMADPLSLSTGSSSTSTAFSLLLFPTDSELTHGANSKYGSTYKRYKYRSSEVGSSSKASDTMARMKPSLFSKATSHGDITFSLLVKSTCSRLEIRRSLLTMGQALPALPVKIVKKRSKKKLCEQELVRTQGLPSV